MAQPVVNPDQVIHSSLIPPPGDPVLFTTAGMHPLTRYLNGQPHPLGRRLVNVQRCLRTGDLDEVDAHDTWRDLGMPVEWTRTENWWSNGPTGLCGPGSEIFIWTGSGPPRGTRPPNRGGSRCGTTCDWATTAGRTGGSTRSVRPMWTPDSGWSGSCRPAVLRQLSHGSLGPGDYRYLHETHGLPRELVDGLLSQEP